MAGQKSRQTDGLDTLPDDRLLAEFSLWSADLVRMADDVARVDEFVDIYPPMSRIVIFARHAVP